MVLQLGTETGRSTRLAALARKAHGLEQSEPEVVLSVSALLNLAEESAPVLPNPEPIAVVNPLQAPGFGGSLNLKARIAATEDRHKATVTGPLMTRPGSK